MPSTQSIADRLYAVLLAWAKLTIRDWRFWAFLCLAGAAPLLASPSVALTNSAQDAYVLSWLLPSIPLCWNQMSLLQAALRMGGPWPIWAFLAASGTVIGGLLGLVLSGTVPFPQVWLDGLRWWGMVVVVGSLHSSVLVRSLLLASMAWFGSTCATYSHLGVWIDIWPRPDRSSVVSLFLAASWLALAACLVLRKAPHEVRHPG